MENAMRSTHTLAKSFLFLGTLAALGQSSVMAQAPAGSNGQGAAIAAPIQNWSYLNHSSTIDEGLLRGQASLVSAAGQAVYMDSLAAINYMEARHRAIDNSVAYTKAIYDRREIRAQYMAKYGPKPFIGEARRLAQERMQPKRLSAEDFDVSRGRIDWPHILRQSQFESVVVEIDKLFVARNPDNSGDGSMTQLKIAKLCRDLHGLLKENLPGMTADQFIGAYEFIRSVDLEAKNEIRFTADDQVDQNAVEGAGQVPVKATIPAATVKSTTAS
jgi:hypothetical protein